MLDHRIGPDTTTGRKAGAKLQVRAVPLERMAKDKGTLSRFQPLNEKERRELTERGKTSAPMARNGDTGDPETG